MCAAVALQFPNLEKAWDNPVGLALYAFVLLGGALLGGLLVGLIGRYAALLFWKELSGRAVLLLRLVGGIGGLAVAFSLIGSGAGFGFGPGAGGLPGSGRGQGEGDAPKVSAEQPDAMTSLSKETPRSARSAAVIRVSMLGPQTRPPHEEPDRFFSIADDLPLQALNIDQVVERIRQAQSARIVQEVELAVSTESSSYGKPFVPQLRDRILRELRVPFSQPDFGGNPLKDRSRYEPAKGP